MVVMEIAEETGLHIASLYENDFLSDNDEKSSTAPLENSKATDDMLHTKVHTV